MACVWQVFSNLMPALSEWMLILLFLQVWSPSMDWRHLRAAHDQRNMEKLGHVPNWRCPRYHAHVIGDKYSRFCLVFPVLAGLFAFLVVSGSQDSPPLHSQGLLRSRRRGQLFYLGHCPSPWDWSNCSSGLNHPWQCVRVGNGQGDHVCHCQFCYPHCERSGFCTYVPAATRNMAEVLPAMTNRLNSA